MPATLKLLQEMQARGAIGRVEVVSGYRNPALNDCADGSRASKHMTSHALDFIPLDKVDEGKLCGWWSREGKAWKLGLGKYRSGRIHIDTEGWRTWGPDGTRKTSPCL